MSGGREGTGEGTGVRVRRAFVTQYFVYQSTMNPCPIRCYALGVLLACAPALALDPERAVTEYHLQRWGARAGLPQSTVSSISQAPNGYLWLSSQGFLVRFDGVRFVSFRTRPGRILTRRSGDLWYSSNTGGAVQWTGNRNILWTTGKGLPSDDVEVFFEDRGGDLWIGTGQGAVRLRGGRLELVPATAGRRVFAFAQGPGGALWVGTADGLVRLEGGTLAASGNHLPGERVLSLAVDRRGGVWAGTANGVAHLAVPGGGWQRFTPGDGLPAAEVPAILADRDGNLWAGTSRGLALLRGARFEALPAPEDEPAEPVLALLEDAEGALWAGTATSGLLRLRDNVFTNFQPPGVRGTVWSAYEDAAGTLWIGTGEHGLLRLRDGRTDTFTTAQGLPSDKVRPLLDDGEGGLWIGTQRGLARRHPDGRIETWTRGQGLPDDYVLSLFRDRGTLWIGTLRGLARLDGGAVRDVTPNGLPKDAIYFVRRDRSGTLLAGTRLGLFREAGGRFERVPGSPVTLVFASHEDAEGTLWLGTSQDGLWRRRQDRWTVFRPRDGLPDGTAFQILEDAEGRFWMTSDRGIYRVRRADLDAFAEGRIPRIPSVLYGEADGMKGIECSGGNTPGALIARDGRFWFPTTRGFAITDPGRAHGNHRPPPVVIEEILSDGQRIPWTPGAPLKLPLGRRNLEIHATVLSLLAPERALLRYHLEGFKQDWTEAGPGRRAIYTNLPAGSYTFRVVGSNGDGVWNTRGARLDIVVPPHFWETAWFAAGLLGFVLLSGIGAGRLRLRSVRRRERELAHLVAERTRDLQREKTRAEAASRAKSEFLANMSHEIRTPLNAVLGMTSMLLETPLSARQRDCVETIRHSGGALLSVINDILDVSKIEAGALEIEIVPFVLSNCLEDALEIVRPKAEAKGLSLVRRIGAGVPDAIASDAARLRQILVNLLDNAIKFTERGEVSLDVELVPIAGDLAGSASDTADPGSPEDSEDIELRFTVRDSGIGIPPERLDRLFQPFSQADSSTTRLYGGTGLGLVISRRLAEHLGGGMWVESTPGKGSAFSFTIRCRPAEATAPSAPTPAPAPLAALLPLRILLAEDNSVNQKVALLMLERLGYRADVAADGYEALAAILRQRYDLVLMDVHMPGMDGLEATRRIRAEAPADHQPRIVALTANVLVEYRKACLEAGMNDFLAKPMSLADLRAALLRSYGTEPPGVPEAPETAPEPASGSPSLDVARLDGLRLLGQIAGRSVLDGIVSSFLTETPRRLERLRQALDQGDAQDLAFVAHSLRGSSAQLGALRLAALSADLEEKGLNAELTEAAALLAELEQEAERVAPLLQAQR